MFITNNNNNWYTIMRRVFVIQVKIIANISFNTLRTGDADLRFYVTTVQDG